MINVISNIIGIKKLGYSQPTTGLSVLGTIGDPISGGSTVNKTTTWSLMQSIPIASSLTGIKVYVTATGTLKVKVLQPIKGGSFNVVFDQTVTCSSIGLNTFTVAGGSLNAFTIPANSLVAFHTPSSGGATVSFKASEVPGYSAGYLAGTGDLTGNAVTLTSAAYLNELEYQYSNSFTWASPGNYIIDENYAGTLLPAYAINNTGSLWGFTAGKTTNTGVGLANFLDYYPTSNSDRNTIAIEFQFKAAGDRVCVYKKPIIGGASASEGTIVEADLDANTIKIYNTWVGGTTYTLPSVRDSKVLTTLTLAVGVRYRLELVKTSRTNTVSIINVSSGISDSLSNDSGSSNLSGLSYGRPGFAAIAGTVDVFSTQFYNSVVNPRLLMMGDSITEGSGTTDSLCYAQLTLNALSGNGWFSGDGGTDSTNCLRRLRHELRLCMPRYVLIYIGANNANSGSQTTQFNTDIQNMYATITNSGATPVICTLTPNSDSTLNGRVLTMNTFLLSTGWRLCRFDLALSLNNDGTTYNPTYMADGVHPNAAGHALLSARLQQDFPEIF